MAARLFAWLATGGGTWSLASNWNDVSDGISPSLTVPGPGDDVTVAGPTGSLLQTISGAGTVAAALFSGNTALSGGFALGSLTLGQGGAGGLLELAARSTLTLTGAALDSGSLVGAGNLARLGITGTITLGQGQSGFGAAQANLDATAGAIIQAGAAVLDAQSAALYVDPASSLEIGTLGGAATGQLTVDAGATLSGFGTANAYGAVTNNGTILAAGGALLVGAVTGTGQLGIAAGAALLLNGRTAAGQSVSFAEVAGGIGGTLDIAQETYAPAGTISGFAPGDALDELGSPISAASFTQTSVNAGVLTLSYGGQTADTLNLAGNYAGEVFLTASDGAGGTLILPVPTVTAGGTLSPGTASPDQYSWSASSSGAWNKAANWADLTTGKSPPGVAPGQHDLVTITAPQTGNFQLVAGPGDAAQLTVTGNLGLAGSFALGTLAIGLNAGAGTQTAGQLDLLPATTLTAQTLAIADGGLTVSGGTSLGVAGTLSLGGGPAGVGLPVTALAATAGGLITAASLTLGGGSGDSITTDPVSTIEVGTAGGALKGAVTVDAGATLSGNGQVNPYGSITDNGTISAMATAGGGALLLGSVTGTGVLACAAGATLALNASTANPIALSGGGTLAGSTLALANERVALSGTLTGLAAGDVIDIQNDQITGLGFAASGGVTSCTLYYGSTAVGRFSFTGGIAGSRFQLSPDAGQGTDITIAAAGSGGGSPGQGSTDTLAWAQPVSGAWNHAANWYDVTTGAAATASPGTLTTVQVLGPTGGALQNIAGPGACAVLGIWGGSLLTGAYSAGTLTVGGTLAGAPTTTGTLDLGAGAVLAAATATITDGGVNIDGASTTLTVSGACALGSGGAATALTAGNHATAQLAALALGGGVLSVDSTASIEIGTLGGAAAGAVTFDAGTATQGAGAVNLAGAVVVNGTLTAQAGSAGLTLALGAASGTGLLAIAAEATLQLTAATSCAISFTGAGATLLLPASTALPSAAIGGFTQGDFILTGGNPITGVSYAPGTGGIGTLTLLYDAQAEGQLLLSGSYAGDIFAVQPDGQGSAISVQIPAGGPPAGTATPDIYAWAGPATGGAWSTTSNWQDLTAGQTPAQLAPGAEDSVSVTGGAGTFTTLLGPANAAGLSLAGDVSLAGSFTIGTLSLAAGGALALGGGAALQTGAAALAGSLLLQAGRLTDSGSLALTGAAIAATGGAQLQTASLTLTAGTLATDTTASLEIGLLGNASPGAVTVDPGATLSGSGLLNAGGAVADNGLITASTGTLALGAVTGGGTLLAAPGATLELLASAAAGLTLDFAGPGTLALAGGPVAATIADFGTGDAILLPQTADTALYTATAPGRGTLTLTNAGTAVAALTLEGAGPSQSFTVTAANGGSVLTTQSQPWSEGTPTMTSSTTGSLTGLDFWNTLTSDEQSALQGVVGNQEVNLVTDPLGGSLTSWATYQPAPYANIALVTDPADNTKVVLPLGFNALIAQAANTNPVILTDAGFGNALIAGNAGHDTIVGFGANDTLAGGTGGTVFFAQGGDSVVGGGNDTIVVADADSSVLTAANSASIVWVSPGVAGYQGLSATQITSQGNDIIVAGGTSNNLSNVVVNGGAGRDTVFGANDGGQLVYNGGTGSGVIVAGNGTTEVNGGPGNGTSLWAGSGYTLFNYGAGSASVIGGSGALQVATTTGAEGPITCFGGTGQNDLVGAPGASVFVTGFGPSTVTGAAGNQVWLAAAANNSLIAGTGDVLLDGAQSTGDNVFNLTGAAIGGTTVYGGAGADTILAGPAAATVNAGIGIETLVFTNGETGGTDIINNFNAATDKVELHGYGAFTQADINGSAVLTLSDGTHIQFTNLPTLPSSAILTS